jgi:hypothetical protein
MPTPPVIKMGVWENGEFIGCVLFSRGSTNNLGKPYGLKTTEVCELTRIALASHLTPVSKILSFALKTLIGKEKGLRLIVSFADPEQNHHGGIYQATNWIYTGQSEDYDKFRDRTGRVWHPRQVSATGYKKQYGEYRRVPIINQCERVRVVGKHRYLYPLDRAMHRQIAPLAKPYPKRLARGLGEIDNAPDSNRETGGARPTNPLILTNQTPRRGSG